MRKPYFKTIIESSPAHIYKPVGVTLHGLYESSLHPSPVRDYADLGELKLLNLVTNEKETFTIWHEDCGDFYVCLPTGEYEEDGEEELEVFLLEYFGIHANPDGTQLIHL